MRSRTIRFRNCAVESETPSPSCPLPGASSGFLFHCVSWAGYWVGEHARQHARDATRWLLKQLGLADASYDTVRARVRWQDFIDYGLRNVPRLYGTTEAALRAFYAATESPS